MPLCPTYQKDRFNINRCTYQKDRFNINSCTVVTAIRSGPCSSGDSGGAAQGTPIGAKALLKS